MKELSSKLIIIILISLLHNPVFVFSQDKDEKRPVNNNLGIIYQAGSVMQTNSFVKGQNRLGEKIESFHSLSFEYGIKTDGRKMWHQLYAFPEWGFGLYFADFFDKEELGNPTAFYGYFKGPFKSWKRFNIHYNIGFGLTWNWNPYNLESNPYNIAIGSHRTVYIAVGLGMEYLVAKRLALGFGAGFTHFSNGATSVPNFGLNLTSPNIYLKYQLKKDPAEKIEHVIPKYKPNWDFTMVLTSGVKQVEFDTAVTGLKTKYLDVNYGMLGLMPQLNRQISHMVKFGAGVELFYDGSVDAQVYISEMGKPEKESIPFGEKLSFGVFGSFELIAGKLSLLVQPGYTVIRKEIDGQAPAFYQRAGIKYYLFKDFFAGINIRAHDFGVADYIEWNIGYRLRWGN